MSKAKFANVGGQAVMEGIMMRSPKKTVLSVRMPDGGIKTEKVEYHSLREKYRFMRAPIIRGAIAFFDSLVLGFKTTSRSASLAGLEEETKGNKKMETFVLALSSLFGVAMSVALFILLPVFARSGLENLFNFQFGWFRTLFEGVLKIGIFVLYIFLISLLKDIKRLFKYHGAEHKTIFCFEAGDELTVENVKKYGRFHPRCGTSFLILVMIVSILFFSIFSGLSNGIYILLKLLLLPIVAGLSFEVLRFTAKYDNTLTRILIAPGKALQHLTTSEPDETMIEVAIAALTESLRNDTDGTLDVKSAYNG